MIKDRLNDSSDESENTLGPKIYDRNAGAIENNMNRTLGMYDPSQQDLASGIRGFNVQTAQMMGATGQPGENRKPFNMKSKRNLKLNTTNDGVEPWNKEQTSFEKAERSYSPRRVPNNDDSDDDVPREI